jgi:hypothetical protein
MASVTVPTPETCSVTFWMRNLVGMYNVYMYISINIHVHVPLSLCVYLYLYLYICAYTCIYTNIHSSIHIGMRRPVMLAGPSGTGKTQIVNGYIFIYVYTYTHIYTYIYTYKYMYIYPYIYIFIYKYTCLISGMRRPVMLAGPSGTGKTQIVNGMLSIFDPLEFLSCNINFNFYTTSAVLQSTISIPLGMICLYVCVYLYVFICIYMYMYIWI